MTIYIQTRIQIYKHTYMQTTFLPYEQITNIQTKSQTDPEHTNKVNIIQ